MHPIVRWMGVTPGLWSSVVTGQACNPVFIPTPGLSAFDNWVLSLHVHDDGSGSALYAGGWFNNAGAVPARRIASWNGAAWATVGAPSSSPIVGGGVTDMTTHQGTLCVSLLTSGTNPCVVQWDGSEWQILATGQDVRVIASYAGDLFVGGYFSDIGGVSALQIARWDGVSWSPLGSGCQGGYVGSLDAFGSNLIAGGMFQVAGGILVDRVARWDGGWHAINPSFAMPFVGESRVHGDALYAGGAPATIDSFSLVRWDGAQWAGIPNPFVIVNTLSTWNGNLCAGGLARHSTSWAHQAIGRWDGVRWIPVVAHGQSPNNDILAVQEFQGDLYVGGKFTAMAAVPTLYVARLACVPATCYADCDANATLNAADFGCFQTKFLASTMSADCNQDFALNVADFGCFQTRFVQGCP